MKQLKEPDWEAIVNSLINGGYTQLAIEASTGVPQSQVSKMMNGKYKHPSYMVGNAIMTLYIEVELEE